MATKKRDTEKVILPSEALAAYERAFRSGKADEVETLLREMLSVQVAVVESKELAEAELRWGKKLNTVSVSYGVFRKRGRDKRVYELNPRAYKTGEEFLSRVGPEEILPNRTYVLLSSEGGYDPKRGLTFEGAGVPTGFSDLPEAEVREKRTEGYFQSWEEHARGSWERSERIVNCYRPFMERWASSVLELANQQLVDFIDTIVWVLRIAVWFHDVGKLNEAWQRVVWENENVLSGRMRDGYIARTSPVDHDKRKALQRPPSHAPFAYPFLRQFLRKILGDYRFLDAIALATARHHSLEVSGAINDGQFQQDGQRNLGWLAQRVQELFVNLSGNERQRLGETCKEAVREIQNTSEADEPPGPTDDFYFLYCLANRLVKVCDWEDASGTDIELREVNSERQPNFPY